MGGTAFEHYVQKGGRRLRCGYTTGSCAALAAGGAARMLLEQQLQQSAALVTPKGLPVTADLLEQTLSAHSAGCAVRKDAGDDVDCTDGILVYAEVALRDAPGIVIDGGEGVGRVTRPGLDQPVGAAAINRVPRQMIARAVDEQCKRCGYPGGLSVTIRVPGGAEIARKTFNPQLGIEGGISILGTSGVVEPQSVQALVDTIAVELRMLYAAGHRRLILTPGNYGESFLKEHPPRAALAQVKCSNFIGEALDLALATGFAELVLVGHAGKFVKLAAGVMNTHSRWADARQEVLAAHAAAAGGDAALSRALLDAVTVDECIGLLDAAGLRGAVMAAVRDRALRHVLRRAGGIHVELVIFSNHYGPLCWTAGAGELFGLGDTI